MRKECIQKKEKPINTQKFLIEFIYTLAGDPILSIGVFSSSTVLNMDLQYAWF